MVSSGVQFLSPVTVDDLHVTRFESLDKIEGIKQTGLVILRIDSAPPPAQPEAMPSSPPKPNPSDEAAKALKAAQEAVERLGLDYDRMWLVSLLQEPRTRKRLFTTSPPPAPSLNMALQDLANLAKEREIAIAVPENFDDSAYLNSNPDVAAEVGNEGFGSGYEHYVLYGHLESRQRPIALS